MNNKHEDFITQLKELLGEEIVGEYLFIAHLKPEGLLYLSNGNIEKRLSLAAMVDAQTKSEFIKRISDPETDLH
jgi:hypothetical protein